MELSLSDDSNRYDGNPHPHPHLICTMCKKIMDIDVDDLGERPQQAARRTGYRIVSHQFDFYGICPWCQEDSN